MIFDLELNNKTNTAIQKKFLERIALETFVKTSRSSALESKRVSLSVAVVDDKEIAFINKQYRQKNSPTDVLSFGDFDSLEKLSKIESENVFLGELIICPTYIEKSAQQQSIEFKDELTYIISHGILHLLGFDHEKEMFEIQDKVVEKIHKK